MMKAFIVGGLDGSHLWLQWDECDGSNLYEVRLAFREEGGEWQDFGPPMESRVAWFILNLRRPRGVAVRAMVRAVGQEFVMAVEARFTRSTCLFEFSSAKKELYFPATTTFHCVVDGVPCSYRTVDEIAVSMGEKSEVELEALASSWFAQLDSPDDFVLRPERGVVIRNIEPSRNDIVETGRDFTELVMAERDGPFSIAFLPRSEVR